MGIFTKLKQIFTRTKKEEAIQSDSNRFKSDSKRFNKRFKALESDSNFATYDKKFDKKYQDEGHLEISQPPLDQEQKLSEPIELQKESLQLGVAAGYTGRYIKEIEASLNRIETQMVSKDWFSSKFGDQSTKTLETLKDIKNVLERHDSSALKRFEAIENALIRMNSVAKDVPEPIKQKLINEIESIKSNLPLTHKMSRLVEVVKESGKISYDELASRLGISRSALRGLLSNTMKRTNEIERYSVDNKGWVRYKYPKTTQISIL